MNDRNTGRPLYSSSITGPSRQCRWIASRAPDIPPLTWVIMEEFSGQKNRQENLSIMRACARARSLLLGMNTNLINSQFCKAGAQSESQEPEQLDGELGLDMKSDSALKWINGVCSFSDSVGTRSVRVYDKILFHYDKTDQESGNRQFRSSKLRHRLKKWGRKSTGFLAWSISDYRIEWNQSWPTAYWNGGSRYCRLSWKI